MKRLIALAALLCAASGCTTTTENANTGANTNNANAAATATATPAAVSQADIEAKEKQTWDAVKTKNADAFGAMLAEDFIYVSDDGVYDKAGTIKGVQGGSTGDAVLSNFKFLPIDADAAAVTYDVAWTGTRDGKPVTENMRASSAWAKRGGNWVVVYHQDTVAGAPPPGETAANANTSNANAPAANANSNSAASNTNTAAPSNANTSASPTTAEAANPIDKEKKVWEELKAKDYAAFATDLADDAVEVEPQGRMDKAGTVAGVKMMDASKYTLSDWKETKIDGDASVVTYLVKSADGKEEERHSTVWAKRGPRWYAILHQGTPVRKK